MKCVCEQEKCMAIELKLCPVCQDILKSTYSRGKCHVNGKKPIMIVPATVAASSSNQKGPTHVDISGIDESTAWRKAILIPVRWRMSLKVKAAT